MTLKKSFSAKSLINANTPCKRVELSTKNITYTSVLLQSVLIVMSSNFLQSANAAVDKSSAASMPAEKHATVSATSKAYATLSAGFEQNMGQTAKETQFFSHGFGYGLFLTPTGPILSLESGKSASFGKGRVFQAQASEGKLERDVIRVNFLGGNKEAIATGMKQLPGDLNYLKGKDPKNWTTGVPRFSEVRYHEIYPDIDVVYYANQYGELEYDLILAPGADPKVVSLAFDGVERVSLDKSGNLVLHTSRGNIVQQAPIAYQNSNGERITIDSHYVMSDNKRVALQLAAYDETQPLVIDPVLAYGTYLGGSATDDGQGIAVDQNGMAFVVGGASSADFPIQTGYDDSYGNYGDAFVAKFSSDGSRLIYATYLGGSARDLALDIALDGGGRAYVTGLTSSSDFPTTSGAFQSTAGGGGDAFVARLSPSGKQLDFGTYLGGSARENGYSIAVDANDDAYITGYTQSPDFPTTGGAFQPTYADGRADAFATKLSANGTSLVYSTYLGGSTEWDEGLAIAVDVSGNAYITGDTTSEDFPTTPEAFQPEPSVSITQAYYPVSDVFVSKLSPDGASLVYSTYLGSGEVNGDVDGEEEGMGIAVDSAGHAYVTGFTDRPSFPVTPGAYQTYSTAWGGKDDVFVTKFSVDGSSLVYSTYIGGNTANPAQEFGTGIAVDDDGNAYVTGWTNSTDFPTVNPVQAGIGSGSPDAFLTKVNASGSALLFSTFIGGDGPDRGWALAIDNCRNIYGTGLTASVNFPTTSGAYDRNCGTDGLCNPVGWYGTRQSDAYVVKIQENPLCRMQ